MSYEMDRGFTFQPHQNSTNYDEAAFSFSSLGSSQEGLASCQLTSAPIPPVQFASIRQQQPTNWDNTPISRTLSQQQQQRQYTGALSLDGAGTPIDRRAFGHIPGINPGQTWQRRDQASLAGVHPPPQAGIYGTEKRGGAVSVVLNDGYPDGDCGDIIWYMGSGGFLDGEKKSRTMQNNQDPSKGGNAALRMSLKTGLPVRVLRGSDARHSPWAPETGYRYDGLYEVTRFDMVPDPTGNTQFTCLIFRMERLECDTYTIPTKVGFGQIAETKTRQANARLLEEDNGDDLAPNSLLQRHRTPRSRRPSNSQPGPSKLNPSPQHQRGLSQHHTSAPSHQSQPLLQRSSNQPQQQPTRPDLPQPVLVEPESEYKQVLNKLSFKKVKGTAPPPPAAIEASSPTPSSFVDAPQPQNSMEAFHLEKPAAPTHQHDKPARAPSPIRPPPPSHIPAPATPHQHDKPTRAPSTRPPPPPSHIPARPPCKRSLPTSPPARGPHPSSSRPNPPDHPSVNRGSNRHEEPVIRRTDDEEHVRHDRRERWRDDRGGDIWRRSHVHHHTSVDYVFSRHEEPVSRRRDDDDGGRMRHDCRECRRNDRGADCWRHGHANKPHRSPSRPPSLLLRRGSNPRSPPLDKRARHKSTFPYQRPPCIPSSHGHSYRPPLHPPPPSRAHAEAPCRPSYPEDLPAPTGNASVVAPQALSPIAADSSSSVSHPVASASSPPALPTPKGLPSRNLSGKECRPTAQLVNTPLTSTQKSPCSTVPVIQDLSAPPIPQHRLVSEEAHRQDGNVQREEKPLFICSDGSSDTSLEWPDDRGQVEHELSPLPLDDFSGLAHHEQQTQAVDGHPDSRCSSRMLMGTDGLTRPQSPTHAASKEMWDSKPMMNREVESNEGCVKVEEDELDGADVDSLKVAVERDSVSDDVCISVLEMWCGLDEFWQNEIARLSGEDSAAGKRVFLSQQTGDFCIDGIALTEAV